MAKKRVKSTEALLGEFVAMTRTSIARLEGEMTQERQRLTNTFDRVRALEEDLRLTKIHLHAATGGKPSDHETRLATLERLQEGFARNQDFLVRHVERLQTEADARPRVPPPAAQTSAPEMTDEEHTEAQADAELRQRMATQVRDWWLTTFADELAGKDLNFAALLWVEMLAVAIAGSIDVDEVAAEDDRRYLDVNTQIVVALMSANEQLNRRVRAYVDKRQANPEQRVM